MTPLALLITPTVLAVSPHDIQVPPHLSTYDWATQKAITVNAEGARVDDSYLGTFLGTTCIMNGKPVVDDWQSD